MPCFDAKEQNNAKTKNPHKKPPVAPKRAAAPPLKPEKTGKPTKPTHSHTATAATACHIPNVYPQRAIARVCKVKGTPNGEGIIICEISAITDAHTADITEFKNFCFLILQKNREGKPLPY